MRIFIIVLLVELSLFSTILNPYKSLSDDEKLEVMFNYYLNKNIRKKISKIPVKEILKDDGASLDPVKYEFYFSYIQRLKAIKESRENEQKKIDIKYESAVKKFNIQLAKLKKFYQDDTNLTPLIQDSINKAFLVVYGKPKIIDPHLNKDTGKITAILDVDNIYNISTFKPKKIRLYLYRGVVKSFLQNYDQVEVYVRVDYDKKYISYNDIKFIYNQNSYIATFVDSDIKDFKMELKIDQTIFKPITIIKDKKDK